MELFVLNNTVHFRSSKKVCVCKASRVVLLRSSRIIKRWGLRGCIHLCQWMDVLQGDSGKPSPFPSLSLPGYEMKRFVLPCIHTIIHRPHPKQHDQQIVKWRLQFLSKRECCSNGMKEEGRRRVDHWSKQAEHSEQAQQTTGRIRGQVQRSSGCFGPVFQISWKLSFPLPFLERFVLNFVD